MHLRARAYAKMQLLVLSLISFVTCTAQECTAFWQSGAVRSVPSDLSPPAVSFLESDIVQSPVTYSSPHNGAGWRLDMGRRSIELVSDVQSGLERMRGGGFCEKSDGASVKLELRSGGGRNAEIGRPQGCTRVKRGRQELAEVADSSSGETELYTRTRQRRKLRERSHNSGGTHGERSQTESRAAPKPKRSSSDGQLRRSRCEVRRPDGHPGVDRTRCVSSARGGRSKRSLPANCRGDSEQLVACGKRHCLRVKEAIESDNSSSTSSAQVNSSASYGERGSGRVLINSTLKGRNGTSESCNRKAALAGQRVQVQLPDGTCFRVQVPHVRSDDSSQSSGMVLQRDSSQIEGARFGANSGRSDDDRLLRVLASIAVEGLKARERGRELPYLLGSGNESSPADSNEGGMTAFASIMQIRNKDTGSLWGLDSDRESSDDEANPEDGPPTFKAAALTRTVYQPSGTRRRAFPSRSVQGDEIIVMSKNSNRFGALNEVGRKKGDAESSAEETEGWRSGHCSQSQFPLGSHWLS